MSLEGDLSELTFAELAQLYGTGRHPVAVHLLPRAPDDPGQGVFWMERGMLTGARFGGITGREAVRRALALGEGPFRVELDVPSAPGEQAEPLEVVLREEQGRLEAERAGPADADGGAAAAPQPGAARAELAAAAAAAEGPGASPAAAPGPEARAADEPAAPAAARAAPEFASLRRGRSPALLALLVVVAIAAAVALALVLRRGPSQVERPATGALAPAAASAGPRLARAAPAYRSATSGAWSLVPNSRSDSQRVAPAASASLAST